MATKKAGTEAEAIRRDRRTLKKLHAAIVATAEVIDELEEDGSLMLVPKRCRGRAVRHLRVLADIVELGHYESED